MSSDVLRHQVYEMISINTHHRLNKRFRYLNFNSGYLIVNIVLENIEKSFYNDSGNSIRWLQIRSLSIRFSPITSGQREPLGDEWWFSITIIYLRIIYEYIRLRT